MKRRILLFLILLITSLPFFSTAAADLDTNSLLSQLDGESCLYTTDYNRQDDYKFFSRYSPEQLSCERNRVLFKKLFIGSIGCRMHAAYCLYDAPSISSEARSLLHKALSTDSESFDYAGIRGSDLKIAAIRVLSKHRAKESISALAALLSDDESVQQEVLKALKGYGPEALAVFESVARLTLKHSSYHSLWLETLAVINPAGSIPFLEAGLKRDEPGIRKKASALLSAIPAYEKSNALLLKGIADPTLLNEVAGNLNAEALRDREVSTTLLATFSENATTDAKREQRLILTKALLAAGTLPVQLCKHIEAQALTTTVYKLFDTSLALLSKACPSRAGFRKQLFKKLVQLPPAMRAAAITSLSLNPLGDTETGTLACYRDDLSYAVTKALKPVSNSRDCSNTAEIEKYIEKRNKLRGLLNIWLKKNERINSFHVTYSTTYTSPTVVTNSFSATRNPEAGTIVFKFPHQYRKSTGKSRAADHEKLKIINGLQEWSVSRWGETGQFGSIYEDWHFRQPYVPTAPLIRKRVAGSCSLLSGLPGRFRKGTLTTDLEYLESFKSGGMIVHHLRQRAPYQNSSYHITASGLLLQEEKTLNTGKPPRWDTEYLQEQTRAVTIYSDFQINTSVDESLFEFTPRGQLDWTRRIHKKKGLTEEKIR